MLCSAYGKTGMSLQVVVLVIPHSPLSSQSSAYNIVLSSRKYFLHQSQK